MYPCHKMKYDSKAKAMNAMSKCSRSRRSRGENRAYKCKECGFYHLTSQKKKITSVRESRKKKYKRGEAN